MTEPDSGLSGPYWTQTADLDGDGIQDVIALSHCGTPGSEIMAYNSLEVSLRWTMANSTSSRLRHGARLRITSVL